MLAPGPRRRREPGTYHFGYVASDGSQESDVATVPLRPLGTAAATPSIRLR